MQTNANVTAEIVTISPAIAKEWLRNNTKNNRKLSDRLVTNLAKDITGGRWKLNGESIILTDDDELLDGQHRLSAIVKANQPVQSLVVRGVKQDVFTTVDTGKMRSKQDALGFAGHVNVVTLSSALALIERYMTCRLPGKVDYTNTDILVLAERYPKAVDSASFTERYKKRFRILTPRVMATAHFIFSSINKEQAETFLAQVILGVGLEQGSPALALRQRLEMNHNSSAKYTAEDLLAMCIRGWNAYREKRSLTVIRMERFNDTTAAYPRAI